MNEERKDKGARERKSRGLYYIEFSGLGHLSMRITSSWIFTTSCENRLPSPSAPLRLVSLRLFNSPYRFTTAQPRAPGRRFVLAPVLLVEGAISARGTKVCPTQRNGRLDRPAAPRTRSAGCAASPRHCPQTPLAPSATWVSFLFLV